MELLLRRIGVRLSVVEEAEEAEEKVEVVEVVEVEEGFEADDDVVADLAELRPRAVTLTLLALPRRGVRAWVRTAAFDEAEDERGRRREREVDEKEGIVGDGAATEAGAGAEADSKGGGERGEGTTGDGERTEDETAGGGEETDSGGAETGTDGEETDTNGGELDTDRGELDTDRREADAGGEETEEETEDCPPLMSGEGATMDFSRKCPTADGVTAGPRRSNGSAAFKSMRFISSRTSQSRPSRCNGAVLSPIAVGETETIPRGKLCGCWTCMMKPTKR
mmetsp:Transcript_2979/g.9310  ORF Transcript_2979/g.9310 Transcript_2979/m.9310 type:complete len:280 (+) Transcript_2979:229-1068(+)